MMQSCYAKLHIWSFGLALGILWGLSTFFTGLIAMGSGMGAGFVEVMHTIYIGYAATPMGSVIGGAWGFVDMFFAGVIIAALYNLSLRACCKGKSCDTTQDSSKTQ